MASRIRSIIAIADMKTEALVEALPEDSKVRRNTEGIGTICKALLERRTPLVPTAGLVSEEGKKHNPHFPSEQTIYNSYRSVLQTWKKAYYDVMNIDADPDVTLGEVSKIDTSLMNPATGDLVDRLKAIIIEVNQRCNVLKRIIDEGVPVRSEDGTNLDQADDAIGDLTLWLSSLPGTSFEIDDYGLKVSRRTPPGTRIMDARLLGKLRVFAEQYVREGAARRQRETR